MVCLPVRGTGATSCAIKNVGTDPRISPTMKLSVARSGNDPYISLYKFPLPMRIFFFLSFRAMSWALRLCSGLTPAKEQREILDLSLAFEMTPRVRLLRHGIYTEPFSFAQGELRRRIPCNDQRHCPLCTDTLYLLQGTSWFLTNPIIQKLILFVSLTQNLRAIWNKCRLLRWN